MDITSAEMIYFDMDGVLADFDRGVSEICGLDPISQNSGKRDPAADDVMWERVKEAGHFYDMLEPMPGAKELFDAVYSKYGKRCEILTGIPKPRRGVTTAEEDKTAWVRRLLSKDIVVNIVLREEKPRFCKGPGFILIDDMKRNIRDWEAAGGTGILHVSPGDTIGQLKKMGVL